MGEDGITIKVHLDTSEIQPDIKQVVDASKDFGKRASQSFEGASKSASGIFKGIRGLASGAVKSGLGTIQKAFSGLTKAGQGLTKAVGGTLSRGFMLFRRNAGEGAKAAEASFKSLLNTAKRIGPMILGIRGAFSILQKGASSFLASNKQLQNQLGAVWTAIGNVIGPVITMLVNLLSTLVSYLISFLHLIGLSSMSASEAAKKTKGAAGSMQKSLMQFDELNKLQDNSGGGGAGSLTDMKMPEILKKLGDAIKQLMADLKLTWKQAWDENGRGEKMMAALKQLLIDIIDLVAEFILALDRAWMNADNGKKIFADIMEIITNLAIGFDTIVKAFTEWVKNTDWLNILVEDVRKIFDAVNETSVIWREKIAPILASKVAPLMNTISRGFHNILLDIEKIVRGINEGLSSAEGTAMINALADLAIAWTAMKLAFVDMILGIIANIDWTSLAAGITRIANGAKGIMEALTKLFENEQVRTALAKIFDIAWTVISTAFEAISSAITNIVNKINEADWKGFNDWLDKLETSVELGIEEIKPVWKGNASEQNVRDAVATAIAGAFAFLATKTVTGSTAAGALAATITTTGILSLIGMGDPEDGGISAGEDLLDKVLDIVLKVLSVYGFAKGGLVGGLLTWSIGSDVKTLINGAIECGLGTGNFDKEGFLSSAETVISGALKKLGLIVGGAKGAKLGFELTRSPGGLVAGLFLGATAGMILTHIFNKDPDGGGITVDTTAIYMAVIGALLGAGVALLLGLSSPVGWIVAISVGAMVMLAVTDITVDSSDAHITPEMTAKAKEDGYENSLEYIHAFNEGWDEQLEHGKWGGLSAEGAFGRFMQSGMTDAEAFSAMKNEVYQKAKELGLDLSEGMVTEFGAALVKNGVPQEDIDAFMETLTSKLDTEGYTAGEEYVDLILSGMKASASESAPEASEQVARTINDSLVSSDYSDIYYAYGEEVANAFLQATLSGDFSGSAQEFIEKYAEEFGITDTTKLADAGKKQGEVIADGIEETASDIEFSEEAEKKAADNLLVLGSSIQNRQEAVDVGKGIVSGLLHGMSLELPNLVTGLEEGIKVVLGAADTVYTNWKDTTFTTKRDTFLTELTTWIEGTFFLGVTTSVSAVITIVQQSIDSFATSSETRVANMGTRISGTFTGLARAARGWGRDIGSQIAYGMMDTLGMVASAASRIADIIFRYLHFSEPDVGPLKDFHTFMPDMMRLMAEGINQNADKPEGAIGSVVESMAEKMSMLGQLNGIANNVDFQMPAMAMGTVMPYSVASGRTQAKEAQQDSMFEMLVGAFTEALNNMKPTENYVYLDGKQIADSTTKWQRRADRAGGK